jgi:hypothetical protein
VIFCLSTNNKQTNKQRTATRLSMVTHDHVFFCILFSFGKNFISRKTWSPVFSISTEQNLGKLG